MREASRRVAQRIQASGVGTGPESGVESTGVGDHRAGLHGSDLITCGDFFCPTNVCTRLSAPSCQPSKDHGASPETAIPAVRTGTGPLGPRLSMDPIPPSVDPHPQARLLSEC